MTMWVLVGVTCNECGSESTVKVLDHAPTDQERSHFYNEHWSMCRSLSVVGPIEVNGPTMMGLSEDFTAPTPPEKTE